MNSTTTTTHAAGATQPAKIEIIMGDGSLVLPEVERAIRARIALLVLCKPSGAPAAPAVRRHKLTTK